MVGRDGQEGFGLRRKGKDQRRVCGRSIVAPDRRGAGGLSRGGGANSETLWRWCARAADATG